MMTHEELLRKLDELRALPSETEWVEFKEAKGNTYPTDRDRRAHGGNGEWGIGQCFSALSNEARLKGLSAAWLVFGVMDKPVPRPVVGTKFAAHVSERHKLTRLKQEIAAGTGAHTFIEIHELHHSDGRVVMFEIPPALKGKPTACRGKFWGRNGESLVELAPYELEQFDKQAVDSLARDSLLALPVPSGVTSVAFNRVLAIASEDGKVRLWEPSPDHELVDLEPAHHGWANCVVISPDSKTIASCGQDGKIIIWDVAPRDGTADLRQRVALRFGGPIQAHSRSVNRIEFMHNGASLIACTSRGIKTLRLFREAVVAEVFTQRESLGRAIALSRDGTRLGFTDRQGRVMILKTSSSAVALKFKADDGISAIGFHPDGRVLASTGNDRKIRLWSILEQSQAAASQLIERNRLLAESERLERKAVGFAFTPDGKTLASVGQDKHVRLWDCGDGARLSRKAALCVGFSVRCVSFSAAGSLLAFGTAQYDLAAATVYVWSPPM